MMSIIDCLNDLAVATARAAELAAEVAAVNAELESALAVVALYQQRALTAEAERDDANIEVEAGNMRLVELAAEVKLLQDAIAAQEERDIAAAEKANETFFGCDTSDHLADVILELRSQLAAAQLITNRWWNMLMWQTNEEPPDWIAWRPAPPQE